MNWTKRDSAGHCLELTALAELSADLGRQKLLVQASTGNTSVKIGQTLWIKASGRWLANAIDEEIFVPVDLADTGKYLSGELPLPAGAMGSGLKPSIETAMHLTIPHRVVVHVHSIHAIAWAVQNTSLALLREQLDTIRWSWIPYAPSGVPLAEEIRASLRFAPDVFILANHGLVIGADSCEEARKRLAEIEERLAIVPRVAPGPDFAPLERLARHSNLRLPDADSIHSLATDGLSSSIVSGGVLYPCQAIFLGRRTPVVSRQDCLLRVANECQNQNGFRPPAMLIKGHGVLVAKDLTRSESEILMGLSKVVSRLSPDARIAYLTERNVDQLLEGNVYGDARPKVKQAARAASSGFGDASRTA